MFKQTIFPLVLLGEAKKVQVLRVCELCIEYYDDIMADFDDKAADEVNCAMEAWRCLLTLSKPQAVDMVEGLKNVLAVNNSATGEKSFASLVHTSISESRFYDSRMQTIVAAAGFLSTNGPAIKSLHSTLKAMHISGTNLQDSASNLLKDLKTYSKMVANLPEGSFSEMEAPFITLVLDMWSSV